MWEVYESLLTMQGESIERDIVQKWLHICTLPIYYFCISNFSRIVKCLCKNHISFYWWTIEIVERTEYLWNCDSISLEYCNRKNDISERVIYHKWYGSLWLFTIEPECMFPWKKRLQFEIEKILEYAYPHRSLEIEISEKNTYIWEVRPVETIMQTSFEFLITHKRR